jgi:uncharacterized protein (TIGR02001 family)
MRGRTFAKRRSAAISKRAPLRRLTLGAIAAVPPLCLAPPAPAQVAVNIAAQSDDRFRGVSLSDGQPTLSLSVSYDHESGLYGGLTAVAVATERSGPQALGYVAYLGYAHRLDPTASWDVGVTNSDVSVYVHRKYSYNYTELYAGFTKGSISLHLYYSPNYFFEDTSTLYVDLDGAFHPIKAWRLFGHLGVLAPLGAPPPASPAGAQVDLRAGLAREFRRVELSLAWSAAAPSPVYPAIYRQPRNAIILSATYFF